MKEFAAVITIDIPVLLTAENKNDALQQATATDKAYLIKRIQKMEGIQITVPYIKELQEEKKQKGGEAMAFDKELFKVKARVASDEDYTTPTDKVVCGFYYRLADVDFVDVENEGYAERLEYPNEDYCIACDTLCRNTGIKVKGRYVYEYDLVMYGSPMTSKKMGMIVWNELQNQYGIKASSIYNQLSTQINCIVEIIGNCRLSDKDAAVFQEYSENEAKKYKGFEPVVECRRKQHLNRIHKDVCRNMGLRT